MQSTEVQMSTGGVIVSTPCKELRSWDRHVQMITQCQYGKWNSWCSVATGLLGILYLDARVVVS